MTHRIRTVGCFLEYQGKFLILQRKSDKKFQGGCWGLVAGKAEPGESDEETILREIKEETGYEAKKEELEFLGDWTFDFPEMTVEFPVFRLRLKEPIEVKHHPDEHQAYKWVTAEEFYNMKNLVHGNRRVLELIGYIKK